MELSKYINFSVDYGGSGEVKISLGSSGTGNLLLEKTNVSTIENVIQEGRIIFKISRDGIKSIGNGLSSGLLSGIKNFYDFVGDVKSEISSLAGRVSRDFNEIRQKA